jgi:hypothetical protein
MASNPMDDSRPSPGKEAARSMAEIADEFLAAIRAGVPQEQAGRQAAEAKIDMLTASSLSRFWRRRTPP